VLKDVPDIIKPVLKQYALSVMSKPIPKLKFVAHMVGFMTVPGVKVKKQNQSQREHLLWSRYLAE